MVCVEAREVVGLAGVELVVLRGVREIKPRVGIGALGRALVHRVHARGVEL